jgi:predicted enzyme related to lactoylglutathione lyase
MPLPRERGEVGYLQDMRVASAVFFSGQLGRCTAFYKALGVPLQDEDHGDGLVHAAGDLDGVHVAVFPAAADGRSPAHHAAGSTFLGFWVPSLEAALDALRPLGTEVVLGHQVCEWGCRVVVADPDGRAVELNQRDHCPPEAG